MDSLQTILPSPSSTPVSLSLLFYGNGVGSVIYPLFVNGLGFVWNPTQPYSSVQFNQYFGAPTSPFPSYYLNTIVMNNVPSNIWAWPSTTGSTSNTFIVPSGYLTLYGLMNSMYEASQLSITLQQYQDITGFAYQETATPTVAAALTDYATINGYTPQLQWITQESTNLFRIVC